MSSECRRLGVPPVAPWNRLWKREIPQWKDYGLKDFVNAAELPSESTGAPIRGKMPYNAQVTPWFRVSAPAGIDQYCIGPVSDFSAPICSMSGKASSQRTP